MIEIRCPQCKRLLVKTSGNVEAYCSDCRIEVTVVYRIAKTLDKRVTIMV